MRWLLFKVARVLSLLGFKESALAIYGYILDQADKQQQEGPGNG